MNVAYLCFDHGIPVLGFKGASVHVREFSAALTALGQDVAVFCARRGSGNLSLGRTPIEIPSDGDDRAIAAKGERLGCGSADGVLAGELRKLVYNERLPARFAACVAREGIALDVLYERHALFVDAGASIAASDALPRILEVNAPLADEQEKFRELRLGTLAREMERRNFCAADHVIAVSDAVAAYVEERGVAAASITVVPNGVDAEHFARASGAREVRGRLGAGTRPIVAFVGSLKPWHGLGRLLDVAARQAELPRNPLFVIVGDGPEFEYLRARIDAEALSANVVLAGRIPYEEIPAYLAAAEITVAPYDPDPDFYFSPLKIVESLAAGKPVVAPALGQIESLVQDGRTGALYDPARPNGPFDALRKLLADPVSTALMGARAAEWVSDERTWAHNGRIVERLMHRLIQDRKIQRVR